WCYQPVPAGPDVSPLPALTNGFITFGCFNKMAKITPPALSAWASLLDRVPQSRLLIKSMSLSDENARLTLLGRITEQGIDENRVDFAGKSKETSDHLSHYHRLDIALDTFPYNGTTTTCDALWMGVPVVALAGNRHVARVGVSLLTDVDLPEMIGSSIDDY